MIAFFLVLVVVGCAGAGDEEGERDQISRAEFAEQANAICETSKRRIVKGGIAIFRRANSDEGARHDLEVAAVENLLIPSLEGEVEAIRELGAPAGDEPQIRAFLKALEGAIGEAHTDPLSYVQAEGRYRPGSFHYGKASRLADAYGLTSCPQG